MTLPDERYRAVIQTRRFLFDLCNPQHTPKVPKLVRETEQVLDKKHEKIRILRHFSAA